MKGLEGLPTQWLVGEEVTDADRLQTSRLPAETLLTSRLRYFSRDARQTSRDGSRRHPNPDVAGFGYDRLGGVAAWNDLSDCSRAARAALTSAAGIKIPNRQFVLWTLSLYLLVLVPANWALFRALGRVEWAWVAVPFLAVAGTWFVIHMAQLDIGFVRSRSEIAILEAQPDYRRGHLTRYIGLYTSLSTRYASRSPTTPPCRCRCSHAGFGDRAKQSPDTVTLRRLDRSDESIRLEDFLVNSASTGMVHSEEMWDLGGSFRLTEPVTGRFRFENPTAYALRDVGLVRRHQGVVEVGWIGFCAAEGSSRFQFRTVGGGRVAVGILERLRLRTRPHGPIRFQSGTAFDWRWIPPDCTRVTCGRGWLRGELPVWRFVRRQASDRFARCWWRICVTDRFPCPNRMKTHPRARDG